MKDPNFSNHQFARRKKPIQVCTIEEIKNLGTDYCEEEVVCKATIKLVEQTSMWNRNICSSCYSETEFANNDCFCKVCKRNVAQSLKRYITKLISYVTIIFFKHIKKYYFAGFTFLQLCMIQLVASNLYFKIETYES